MATDEELEVEDTEEDGELVDLSESESDEEEEEPPLNYDERDPNLVEAFKSSQEGRAELRRIGEHVIALFDEAWEGSEQYRQITANNWRLFAGELPPKDPPYQNTANVHIPIMLPNMSRLQLHMTGELFGDWTNVAVFRPIGEQPDAELAAKLMTKHTNWQITEKMRYFPREIGHRGMMQFLIGDVVCHSYFDELKDMNIHQILTADDFVTPYGYTSTCPDLSDLPYYCKVLRPYRHELQRKRGQWENLDAVLKREAPQHDEEPDSPFTRTVAEIQGIEIPDGEDGTRPYKIVQWEGWLELPQQDQDRFCQVIMDTETKLILSLSVHEEDNWQDRARYDAQLNGLEEFRAARAAYEGAQRQIEAIRAESGGVLPPEMEEMANLPPPTPPTWVDGDPDDPGLRPKKVRTLPIHMFTKTSCIEPLQGNMGLGVARIQADLNRSANDAASKFADAAGYANNWTVISSDAIGIEGDLAMRPGKHLKATGIQAERLADQFFELRPTQPSPGLQEQIRMAIENGQSSIQSPDVLSGEPGKSGETYRGLAARREQAYKQLGETTRKYAWFLKAVLEKNSRLNAMHMPEHEFFSVTEGEGKDEVRMQLDMPRRMYERRYTVELRSDLRFTTKAEKVAEADETLQMVTNVPQLATNPALVWEASKKWFEVRGQHHMVPLLGQKPPAPEVFGAPPAPPPGVMPQGGEGGPPPGPPPEGEEVPR